MRKVLLAGVVLAVAGLAGCGDDDQASPTEEAATDEGSDIVEVVAHDIAFDETAYDATAGTVEFVYTNEGSINHSLVIEDVDGFELQVAGNGDVDRGAVDLEAGTYTFYCDVPGHRDAGMEATIDVR